MCCELTLVVFWGDLCAFRVLCVVFTLYYLCLFAALLVLVFVLLIFVGFIGAESVGVDCVWCLVFT